MVLSSIEKQNAFLWKTFLDFMHISNIDIYIAILPNDIQFKSNFIEKLSLEDLNKWILGQKPIWEEVTDRALKNVPALSKLEEFKKIILPELNKIKDKTRRDILLDKLAVSCFGSSKEIFFQRKNQQHFYSSDDKSKIVNKEETKSIDKNEEPLTDNKEVKVLQTKDSEYQREYVLKSCQFYHKILLADVGYQAREYLKARDITQEHIIKWGMGYCPSDNSLARKVEIGVVSQAPLLQLGLIKKAT